MLAMLDEFVQRKNNEFGQYNYLLGNFSYTQKSDGQRYLWMECREPPV